MATGGLFWNLSFCYFETLCVQVQAIYSLLLWLVVCSEQKSIAYVD